jgi:hypothetical protein
VSYVYAADFWNIEFPGKPKFYPLLQDFSKLRSNLAEGVTLGLHAPKPRKLPIHGTILEDIENSHPHGHVEVLAHHHDETILSPLASRRITIRVEGRRQE